MRFILSTTVSALVALFVWAPASAAPGGEYATIGLLPLRHLVRHGRGSRHGVARHGVARRGEAGRGEAWLGRAGQGKARYRHYHRVSRRHTRREGHQAANTAPPVRSGLVTIPTAAGRITVAAHLAPRFKALIADLAAAGYHPRRVGCFATSGHVRHSRHYAGAACDFDGSLSRNAFMRSETAHRIIVAHGFRDGCTFRVHGVRDCGHVDDGGGGRYAHRGVRYAHRGVRYAHRRHRRHHYANR